MVEDQRRFNRVKFPLSIRYRQVNVLADVWYTAKLVDLSAGGLRLLSAELLESGARLEFQIVLPIRQAPYFLSGLVIWEKSTDEGGSECGVEFINVTTEQRTELDWLVELLSRSKD